jgi:hypothetical protein
MRVGNGKMPAVARLASVGKGAGFRPEVGFQMEEPRMERIYTDEDSGSILVFSALSLRGCTRMDADK